jgi:hypothetical protein
MAQAKNTEGFGPLHGVVAVITTVKKIYHRCFKELDACLIIFSLKILRSAAQSEELHRPSTSPEVSAKTGKNEETSKRQHAHDTDHHLQQLL